MWYVNHKIKKNFPGVPKCIKKAQDTGGTLKKIKEK